MLFSTIKTGYLDPGPFVTRARPQMPGLGGPPLCVSHAPAVRGHPAFPLRTTLSRSYKATRALRQLDVWKTLSAPSSPLIPVLDFSPTITPVGSPEVWSFQRSFLVSLAHNYASSDTRTRRAPPTTFNNYVSHELAPAIPTCFLVRIVRQPGSL